MARKLVMLTAYDYPTAKILAEVGVDYILVGDSLAMTILGYPDTKSVSIEEMLHHVKVVVRGASQSKVIADMPIGTYDTPEIALKNAEEFIKSGAYGVKIEGAKFDIVHTLITHNIPVMGHLGLLPQTAEKYTVQGRDMQEAKQILNDAKQLDTLGIFALVLECVPLHLAKEISDAITTPTIGIGAGPYCDGQVLVLADVIGLSDFEGKMVKRYAEVRTIIKNAVKEFKEDVIEEKFPTNDNSFI